MDRATWMRVQRGGYGYVVPVPCTIEQLPEGGSRFRITTNGIHPTSTMDQDGVWWTAAQRKEKSNVEG